MNMDPIPPEGILNGNAFVRAFVTIAMSLGGYGLTPLLLFPLLLYPVDRAFEEPPRLTIWLPASILSLFQTAGTSLLKTGSLVYIYYDPGQFVKYLLWYFAYFLIFCTGIFWLDQWLSRQPFRGGTPEPFDPFLAGPHVFRNVFLLFAVFWLPYLILRFPGYLMGDSMDQLFQAFGMMDDTASRLNLLNPEVVLNNHHPVLHTIVMGAVFRLGKMLHSDVLGLFLCTFLQYLMVSATFAAVIAFFTKCGIPQRLRLCLMLLFLLTPIFVNYTVTVCKDVPYACALTWYMLFLIQLLTGERPFYESRGGRLLFGAVVLMLLFTRHNGIYTLLLTLPFVLLAGKGHGRFVAVSMACTLLVFMFITKLLYPSFYITPGSKKEMLSIPVQQTARFLLEYPEEVTEEEREAISAVLKYEELADRYDPCLSDFVKETWNENATAAQISGYFKVWAAMGLRRPLCYLEATAENLYGYFAFGDKAVWRYTIEESENVFGLMESRGFELGYPQALNSLRTLLLELENIFNRLPVLSALHAAALYTWCMLLLFFRCIHKEKGALLLLLLPEAVSLLIALAGPVNAINDLRYMFPIMMSLPAAAVFMTAQTQ